MKTNEFKSPVVMISGIVLGVLMGSALRINLGNQTIDGINMWAQVIMALIAVGGIWIYVSQKKSEAALQGVDLVSFFRRELIEMADKVYSHLTPHTGLLPRIKFGSNSTLDEIKAIYPTEFKAHIEISARLTSSPKAGLSVATQFENDRIDLLNIMEEFAQRALHLRVVNHGALHCVKDAFLRMVERNAVKIIESRQLTGNRLYEGIVLLYVVWRDEEVSTV